jgi:hypothetical protein
MTNASEGQTTILIPDLRARGTVVAMQDHGRPNVLAYELSDVQACALVVDVVAKLSAAMRGRLLAQLEAGHRRAAESGR